MNIRWLLNMSILAGALLGTNLAHATCREAIWSGEGEGRNAWAEKWGYLMPGEAAQLNAQWRYVEFVTGCHRLPTGASCSPQIPVVASGSFVGGLIKSEICNVDCFAPGQPVLVRGEPHGMEDIVRAESRTLTALALGSTPDAPRFTEQPVASFSSTPVDTEILVFEGSSGERLEVTAPHTIVLADGTLVKAEEVRKGDEIAGAHGASIRVIAVNSYPYTGDVFNVELESRDRTENIIVADGFLTGTALFQQQWSHDVFRLLLRDHVDVAAVLAKK